MGPISDPGSPALLMKTPLSRSGTTESPLENEDCPAGCRPESPRVRENLFQRLLLLANHLLLLILRARSLAASDRAALGRRRHRKCQDERRHKQLRPLHGPTPRREKQKVFNWEG